MLSKNKVSKLHKNKIVGWIVLLLVFISGISNNTEAQQNIQFTQYMFNTLSVNPAYAGYKEDWYLQVAHRMQWIGLEDVGGAPVTTQISIDGLTNQYDKKVGLGLQMTVDQIGAQSATSLYADYAYRIQMDNVDMSRLSFGIGVGLTQYATNVSLLHPLDPVDDLLYTGTENTYIPDVRLGVYYYTPHFFVGVSGLDLLSASVPSTFYSWNQDTTVNVTRNPHFYLISGGLVECTDYTKFRPGFLIREDLKGPTSLDLSATFVFDNRFWAGASYRTGIYLFKDNHTESQLQSITNAVCGIVEFQVTDRIRIGYSYDYVLNSLSGYQNGSHELTFGWVLFNRSKRVLSPRFF